MLVQNTPPSSSRTPLSLPALLPGRVRREKRRHWGKELVLQQQLGKGLLVPREAEPFGTNLQFICLFLRLFAPLSANIHKCLVRVGYVTGAREQARQVPGLLELNSGSREGR